MSNKRQNNSVETLGPVMIDLEGKVLSDQDKDLLQNPLVGGVIFFARNFESSDQISDLVKAIHEQSPQQILTCVDQEGGRVQRFQNDFTRLPPLRPLGDLYDANNDHGMAAAKALGWLMASEILSVGVDFSFAPVLDLDFDESEVIGDRAFHSDEKAVSQIARAYIQGLQEAGMCSVAKHFPGHGAVKADSHLELPVDKRAVSVIMEKDVIPFSDLIGLNALQGIMPAHVVYTAMDKQPAGFSKIWLQQVLRGRLGFNGAIFSDDLNMAAATMAGTFTERAEKALIAGCDMVLVCNNRSGATEVLDNLNWQQESISIDRLRAMQGRSKQSKADLLASERWRVAVELAKELIA